MGGIKTEIVKRARILDQEYAIRIGFAFLLGLIPLFFLRERLFQPGYPWLHDGVSNLYPALHVRWSLAHGQLPIHTHLWYGGEIQLFNPLWKGFYPPAWPMFIPGIPLLLATKIVLGLHYFAAAVIAYWYASDDFPPHVAIPFAILFITPMAMFLGHYEKALGWPWFVLLVWQLTPTRLYDHPKRAGLLAGIGLGAMLLAASNYHFILGGILVTIIVLATKTWEFAKGTALGFLVGLPKLLLSIVPVMILQNPDRPASREPTFSEFLQGISGITVDFTTGTITIGRGIWLEVYAVVGVGAIVLSLLTLFYAYEFEIERQHKAWILGVVSALFAGILLFTGFLSNQPVFEIFRVTARANVLIALCLLLICWYGLRLPRPEVRTIAVILVILGAINGVAAWQMADSGKAVQTDVGERITGQIQAAGCSSVWIEESSFRGEQKIYVPYGKVIGYKLTESGVPLTSVNYGKIGQEYTARKNGQLTFDALITSVELPRTGTVELSGGWTGQDKGTIHMGEFTLLNQIQTDRGPVYLYTTQRCQSQASTTN